MNDILYDNCKKDEVVKNSIESEKFKKFLKS